MNAREALSGAVLRDQREDCLDHRSGRLLWEVVAGHGDDPAHIATGEEASVLRRTLGWGDAVTAPV